MMKKTHIATALILSTPLIIVEPISIIGVIGATAPDIDYKIGIEHRTSTHSLLAMGISTLVIYYFSHGIGLVWGCSYLSHLVLDSFTKVGVPFLYPLIKEKFGLKKIHTNSRTESFILLLIIYLLISIFLRY